MLIEGYREGDTIAGEATPPGRGGISVIRVSGEDAHVVVSALFDRELPQAGEFKLGNLHRLDLPDEILDHIIVSFYKAPNSYTGEDVFELSLHGNPILVSQALAELYKAGARSPQAGEFTFRAFINGKLDLTQAEAVADLIAAGSEQSAEAAIQRLDGSLKDMADKISNQLLALLSLYEIELDFAEENVAITTSSESEHATGSITQSLQQMLSGYKHNRSLREGVQVAVVGPPNVGKSSLFNRLINQQKAITHHLPGTTRDAVDASCFIEGIQFRIFDTAGIRTTADEVETVGVELAHQISAECELIIEVSSVDISQKYDYIFSHGQTVIKVMNKIDLSMGAPIDSRLGVSAKYGSGFDELRNLMYQSAVDDETVSQRTVASERQFHLTENALSAVEDARKCIMIGSPPEIIAEELRNALAYMDEMTGKRKLDTILENIFSKFCIGK